MHTDVGGTDEIVDAVSAKSIPIGIYTYVRLCDLLCVCLPLPKLATKVVIGKIAGYWMGGGDHEVPRG